MLSISRQYCIETMCVIELWIVMFCPIMKNILLALCKVMGMWASYIVFCYRIKKTPVCVAPKKHIVSVFHKNLRNVDNYTTCILELLLSMITKNVQEIVRIMTTPTAFFNFKYDWCNVNIEVCDPFFIMWMFYTYKTYVISGSDHHANPLENMSLI